MSTRSSAPMPRLCVCGRPAYHPAHQVPAPPSWWRRLLTLAWPRHLWGHTQDVHEFVDAAQLGATRAQIRRVRKALERERRRAGLSA